MPCMRERMQGACARYVIEVLLQAMWQRLGEVGAAVAMWVSCRWLVVWHDGALRPRCVPPTQLQLQRRQRR